MKEMLALTRAWGMPTHIHVAETRDEVEMMRARTGRSHVAWLQELGGLGPDIQLVHCVHVDDGELALIADSGALVVHCPTSNMYLASGIAPVPAMVQRQIPVALGTDGSASHNSQDLLETLKTAVLLAKVGAGSATALTNRDALQMATRAGALVLGRADLGQISPGFKADLTVVNLDRAHVAPVHRVDSALIYNCNGPDVDTVIVDGRILLDHGRVTVCDEDRLLAECRSAAHALVERATGH
jgi:5-methylthioadenosine/S-adenosylhomocysteine deaminase